MEDEADRRDSRRGQDRDEGEVTPALLLRLRRGDADAAVELDRLYRERLTRFCWGYLGNREDAEDVVQDVFCTVLQSTEMPDRFRAWVYEVCRNRCIDRIRSRNRRLDDQSFPPSEQLIAHVTGHLTRLVKKERRAKLWERFASLPAEQREVLLLRYTEGLSRSEIAQVLGIPEKLVKHRIYNGLEKLREHDSLATDS